MKHLCDVLNGRGVYLEMEYAPLGENSPPHVVI